MSTSATQTTTLVENVPRLTLSPHQSRTSVNVTPTGTEVIELSDLDRKRSRVSLIPDTRNPSIQVPLRASESPTMTKEQRRRLNIQFAACCWALVLAGWNDGSTGPLLPRIQAVYHIGFTIVSLLFICSTVGFVSGAALNVYISDRLGFGKTMLLGSLSQTAAYAIMAPAPPFPVLCLGYGLNGVGIALQDAGANGYVASLKDSASTRMGFLHAAYGLGALCSPLAATHFSQVPRWSFHFLLSLSLAVVNDVVQVLVFRLKDHNACLAEIGQAPLEENTNVQESKWRQMFRLRSLHLFAFFCLAYVGVEVTTGGWIVTYIIDVRKGGPSSGYISSGFFGGLTVGRIALLWANRKIGERRALIIYAIMAIGLQMVVWFVPSLIGGALAVSIIGVFLGPMYPILMNQSARVLPGWLLTSCIGWIAGFGQAGSAMLPFITGAVAGKFGIGSMQPVLVIMMSVMLVSWILTPRSRPHSD